LAEDDFDDTLYIGPESESLQRKRLDEVKSHRDGEAVTRALAKVRKDAAIADVNLMPTFLDAVKTHATIGEIVSALVDVFGTWTEPTAI
jgi:methylmalonyl-CoA mutase N-terminal domain/subunit